MFDHYCRIFPRRDPRFNSDHSSWIGLFLVSVSDCVRDRSRLLYLSSSLYRLLPELPGDDPVCDPVDLLDRVPTAGPRGVRGEEISSVVFSIV